MHAHFDVAGADGVADGIGRRLSVHQAVHTIQLHEQVKVRVADERLPRVPRPAHRGAVVIHMARVERVHLDSVEQIAMLIEQPFAERRWVRIAGMRCNDEPLWFGGSQRREILERVHARAGITVVDQQNVLAGDRAFDAGDERDAAPARVFSLARCIEVAVVQRNRQRVVVKRGRAIDQITSRVAQRVARIEIGVRVELGLQ